MPTPSPDRSRSPLCASLFLALLGSCGGSAETSALPAYRRLELQPVAEPIAARPAREVARWQEFDAAEGFESWTLRMPRREVVEFKGERVLKVLRKQGATIEIPASIRFAWGARLRLTAFVQGMANQLTVRLLAGEREVARSMAMLTPGAQKQEITLHFPRPVAGELAIESIELLFSAGADPTGLVSIAVDDVPLGGELPESILGGFGLVELGTESRRATCLLSEHPLKSTFEVTGSAQELRFSYCLPVEMRVSEGVPQLSLTLRTGDGEERRHRFGFGGDPSAEPKWFTQRVPLGELRGETVTAIFEIPADGALERLCALGRAQLVTPGRDAPTVLLITSDTHRSDHVGFLADEGWLRTDTIDRLAAEGVVFTDVLSSINNTTPSHVSLFTGLSPRDTGIVANLRRLADAAPTLAERFSELGYATIAAVSASPVNYRFTGLGQGFDRCSTPVAQSQRGSEETLRELVRWLPDYEGLPLFVWLHIYDAHAPYQPPREYERLYYPAELDPYDETRPGTDPSIAPNWNREIADPKYTEALYRSEIAYLDERLGELLALDRFARATVAFTADHGEVLSRGKGNFFGHAGLSLDTLAVPLIFRHPSLPAGARRDTPVLQIDVGRTLLNLVGHPEVEFPGRDLFADEARFDGPRFGIEANGIGASVISGRWMLRLALREPTRASGSVAALHEVELFDLEADPHCEHELRDEHPERVAKLRELLVRWLLRSELQDWEIAATVSSENIARHLAELGYASFGEEGTSGEWIDTECACEWCERYR